MGEKQVEVSRRRCPRLNAAVDKPEVLGAENLERGTIWELENATATWGGALETARAAAYKRTLTS
jgi:hypothetical protein